jgi:hypothetical protein
VALFFEFLSELGLYGLAVLLLEDFDAGSDIFCVSVECTLFEMQSLEVHFL